MISTEVTDTFGGEANYSWVKRINLEPNENESHLSVVRRAKKIHGWNGLRCKVENHGDMITLRPYKVCQVMFITWV